MTTVPISLDKLLGKQLGFMNQYYKVTAVSADKPELERVAKKYGVGHHHVEMTRAITPFKDLVAVWKFYRFLRDEMPEMVHSHTPKAGLVGMMAAYFAGVPVRMHTVAGLPLLEATGIKRIILNIVEKITYAFATKVYPNSFAMRDIIIREGFCAAGKLKVLGNGSSNGIDTEYFSPSAIPLVKTTALRAELGITDDDFVFIFVGRLVGDKGINELVEAFVKGKGKAKVKVKAEVKGFFAAKEVASPSVADRNDSVEVEVKVEDGGNTKGEDEAEGDFMRHGRNVKLLLVGPLEEDLDALLPETLEAIQSHPDIISVGYQDDVRPYFALSDALAFPSYREGFPNVVLQAGAMELPCIVTNINGCNEIIEEGNNGMIIPVKDSAALQQAMEKVVDDTENYYSMKSNARPLIESRYRQEVVWQALLEEYKTLIGNVLR
ncbi:glycosyltransferase family 4 protein [Chryseobacterium sp. HSC-36S06]|uniref:glycosyltransferase family 4 protein n=1 Tax=Chryseobacterium sp. HSC-36S06 TaxID=2910970 RepID=UPI00209EC672|nr:glycosyltransferase family 4 protein [Chryseobacterium sp. HSC-36S06]MCP2037691.1 glycosyltransferase involved in cell wall biosynthesis [Chryseobacterium sp. HSC-36S06]